MSTPSLIPALSESPITTIGSFGEPSILDGRYEKNSRNMEANATAHNTEHKRSGKETGRVDSEFSVFVSLDSASDLAGLAIMAETLRTAKAAY